MSGYQGDGPDSGQIWDSLVVTDMQGRRAQHSSHINRRVADRHNCIKGGDLRGETIEVKELIDLGVVDHAATREITQHPECATRSACAKVLHRRHQVTMHSCAVLDLDANCTTVRRPNGDS